MSRITTWLRAVLAAVLLALAAPAADASRETAPAPRAVTSRTHSTEPEGADAVRPPTGSPEFGVVIIVGAVGLLVFFAWLFTRTGGRHSDGVTD